MAETAPNAIPTVVVVGPFPPYKGGIAQHTAQLANGLSGRTHVRRLGWIDQYPALLYGRPQVDSSAGATASVENLLRWWNPFTWIRAGRELRSVDLAILPWVSPVHALTFLTMMTVARSTPVLVHVHNAAPHEPIPFSAFFLRQVLKRSKGMICHGQAIANEVAELGADLETRVVPHAPDLDVAVTSLPPRPPIELLFAGTIRGYKGLDLLLEALVILDRPDINITIAGEVWDEAARPTNAQLTSVPGSVRTHLSYVSDDHLCELLESCHALVAPYRSASQSGIVALATAAGRPAVVTPVGALPEAIEDGVNGIVATRPDDARSLAEAIDRLIVDLDSLALGAAAAISTWDDYAVEALELAEVGDLTNPVHAPMD